MCLPLVGAGEGAGVGSIKGAGVGGGVPGPREEKR